MKFTSTLSMSILWVLLSALCCNSYAQGTGRIEGKVLDRETNEPLPGVNILIENTNKGTTTNLEGAFILGSVSEGQKKLIFSFVGYKKLTETVGVTSGETTSLTVHLSPDPVMMEGISVTALRPDQIAESRLKEADVRKANPRDSGELMRSIQGVDAVRRGPVGLDPVIRGLRETEVGTYLDGTRIFPGGPGRMDSPLSHLDPSAIKNIDVVKGPYALTWGAGNMGAVRVETQPLTTIREPFGGSLTSGYDSNFNALEEAVSLKGSGGKFGYWLHGAWREGNDYESGDGTLIPADFLSREIRGKMGYATGSNSYLSFSIGYQNQEDIDYPGRLLNADYFDTYNYALNWQWEPKNSVVTSVTANAYINNVNHGMDNDGKPTAEPNPNRMPPFALDVSVDAQAHVRGGKIAAELQPADKWNLEIGTDIYSANRDATRFIRRQDNDMLLFTDLMWPDATIMDAGLFAKASHSISERLSTSGTLRFDLVSADADTVSQFFADNVSTDPDASEFNVSGSFTMSYFFQKNWSLGFGIGSVVRTADATERYSDRIPASKAQTSAEFVGNPDLDPERSSQVDLWIDASYPQWSVSLNMFARHMDDYITLSPTNLPKRLPLSPETVYRYVNGEANFWGFDVSTSYRIIEPLTVHAGMEYLWGKDLRVDEPALGVSPLSLDTGLRYDFTSLPLYTEANLQWVGEQDRVAATRGENSTDGYVTADFKTGLTLWQNVSIQAGVKNITDKNYVNHLNAKNPFTGQPLPEPGRIFYGDISFRF